MENKPVNKWTKFSAYCTIAAIVLLMICVVGTAITMFGNRKPTPTTSPQSYAWTACRMYIEKSLKAPSTAKFQSESTGTVYDNGNGNYEVSMWVDADNSFGAHIRSTFYCKVNHSGDQWALVELTEK